MVEDDDDKPNAWLLDPVGSCLPFLADEISFLATAERSFSAITLVPTLLQLVKNHFPKDVTEKFDTFSIMTAEAAELAQRQLDEGMRSARSNACVAFWSAIETTIEETLLNHLLRIPQSIEAVKRRQPNIKEVIISDRNSARLFLRAWEGRLAETDVVERAMQMLSVFDLDFELDDKHRRKLTELCAFRNIAVHRRGVVDNRFKKQVPWCEVEVGDIYKVDREAVSEFFEACGAFCVALMRRITKSPWIVAR